MSDSTQNNVVLNYQTDATNNWYYELSAFKPIGTIYDISKIKPTQIKEQAA